MKKMINYIKCIVYLLTVIVPALSEIKKILDNPELANTILKHEKQLELEMLQDEQRRKIQECKL